MLHPMQESFYLSLRETNSNLVPARVTFSSHEQFKILTLGGEEFSAKLKGRYFHQKLEWPVVGDWVVVETLEGDHQYLQIFETLPRTTLLKRGSEALVANTDWVGLVTSFNQDFNLRRLERGLVMIEDSGATPIIIVNKCDLGASSERTEILQQIHHRFSGMKVLACSTVTGEGMGELMANFKVNQTVSFLGMSGVGKSSLINFILEDPVLATKAIRDSDSRGRHTTTHRQLFKSVAGFWVADNPGIREFSFAGNQESLDSTFDDVLQLSLACKFTDCRHQQEPGCKVQEALESGQLDFDRWCNYLKLKKETDFQIRKAKKKERRSHA
jgi:ribosome biogenesis GTPase